MAFKGDDSTLSLATTVTLALAVAAMVFVKEPLKSSRPTGSGIDRNGATIELKAPARLWEDPFAAVQKDLEARKRDGLVVIGKGNVSLSDAGHSTAKSLTGEVRIQSRTNEDEGDGLDVLKEMIQKSTGRGEQVTALIVMTRGAPMWMTVSRASAIGMPSKPRWKSDVSKRRKGNSCHTS